MNQGDTETPRRRESDYAVIDASALGIPEYFNVAAHFIDRNVDEGRGETVAIACGDERVSYGQLFERVNRFGSSLREDGPQSRLTPPSPRRYLRGPASPRVRRWRWPAQSRSAASQASS